jgi:hypothetical protein
MILLKKYILLFLFLSLSCHHSLDKGKKSLPIHLQLLDKYIDEESHLRVAITNNSRFPVLIQLVKFGTPITFRHKGSYSISLLDNNLGFNECGGDIEFLMLKPDSTSIGAISLYGEIVNSDRSLIYNSAINYSLSCNPDDLHCIYKLDTEYIKLDNLTAKDSISCGHCYKQNFYFYIENKRSIHSIQQLEINNNVEFWEALKTYLPEK